MRLAVSIALLVAMFAACRPGQQQTNNSGLEIAVAAEGTPGLGITPVSVQIRRDGEPISGARVRLSGDMTHAGMVPVLRDAVETEPGVYLAQDFEFTMAGDWIVTAEITLPGGDKAIAELRTGVAGN